ncbi:MAG: Mrp/NBP35 family ATP-binding protein, partial [Candidatus Marinimicrobia bacterium]|nr:Mrp/NBP35 family ATP-binding protein [Candidatus Neomarinimicrobiota bacterium]
VAANLALSLHGKGFKVGLLDLDVYGPSVPKIFNVSEPPQVEDEHSILPAKKYGIELMSFGFFIDDKSPVIWRGPMVMKLVEQFLTDVKWSKLDYLILDLPPGTGDVQLSLSQKIFMTGAVIVTTPQDLALIDVSRGANMFEKMKVPVLGVIENMSFHVCSKCGNKDYVFSSGGGEKESKRLNVPFLGKLPLSRNIMSHTDSGKPTVLADPEGEESKAFLKIVETLLENLN